MYLTEGLCNYLQQSGIKVMDCCGGDDDDDDCIRVELLSDVSCSGDPNINTCSINDQS